MIKIICGLFIVLAGLLLMLPVNADQSMPRFTLPYIGGNLGLAQIQNSNYDHSESFNTYAGFYLVENFSVELWLAKLGEFDLKSLDNTYIKAEGAGITAAYRFDTGPLFALRPSIGVFYSRSEISYEGRKIGEDSDSDWMFGLSGVFTVNKHLLVNINTHLFKNVSGSDIVTFTVGAGYQF